MREPKKILFVNFSKTWGGGENWHFTTASELRKRGWDVVFLVHYQSSLHKKCKDNDFRTETISIKSLSFLNPFKRIKITKLLKQVSPDVVILNASKELKNIAIPAKKAGVKKIIYRRGIPKNVRMNILNLSIFRGAVTHIIVNSKTTLKALAPLTDKLPHIVPQVIYNGLASDIQFSANGLSKTICVASRLSYEKGVDRAIEAMVLVNEKIPESKLLIIGDGNEKENLTQQVSKLGLDNCVEFAGFNKDISSLMKRCSLFVLPSRMEGFGFVLLEAMRMKMPCIAYSNTAAAEIIINKKTGFLIDADTHHIQNLASAITNLLADTALIEEMGNAAFQLFHKEFTIDKAIDNLEILLNN